VPDKNAVIARVRSIGLVSSVVALMAIALTVLTDNRNLGFGQSVTHSQQLFLLLAAAALCVLQAVIYLVHRNQHRQGIPRQRPNQHQDE
jgi:hypothetical protein